MSLCDANIITNSTFSWWAAWLGERPNKLIIAPEKWFGPEGPQDQQDIMNEMTKIKKALDEIVDPKSGKNMQI